MRGAFVVLAALGTLASCKPHVALVPPSSTLTPEQRIATFNQLRGVREKTTTTVVRNCIGDCVTRIDKVLYLADGTEIHHVDDLLSVLPPDSESARSIRAARHARTNTRVWTGAVFATVVATFVLWKQDAEYSDQAFLIGAGVSLVASLFMTRSYFKTVAHEGHANRTYNEGLAEQLYLCVHGMQLVPCEALPMPGTPSPKPPSPHEPLPSGQTARR